MVGWECRFRRIVDERPRTIETVDEPAVSPYEYNIIEHKKQPGKGFQDPDDH
jgi:hypothetical protein